MIVFLVDWYDEKEAEIFTDVYADRSSACKRKVELELDGYYPAITEKEVK